MNIIIKFYINLNILFCEVVRCIMAVCSTFCATFILDNDGNVWTFGDSNDKRIEGNIASIRQLSLANVTSLSTGRDFAFFSDSNGDVWFYNGNNYTPKLGIRKCKQKFSPEKVESLNNIIKVICGSTFAFFIDSTFVVYGIGSTQNGELGFSQKAVQVDPVVIQIPEPIKDISCGLDHSLFLDFSGRVYVCGNNKYGQLGLGDREMRITIILNEMLQDIISIHCGYNASFALDSNKDLYVFGYNIDGRLTLNSNIKEITTPLKSPITIPEIKSISTGDYDLRIIDVNGDFWIYGKSSYYSKTTNCKLLESKNIEYSSEGGRHFFVKSADASYGCGFNVHGQVGIFAKNRNFIELQRLPEEINSKISIPYHYSKVKSARK